MGMTWIVDGALSLPAANVEAWLAETLDPRTAPRLPALLGAPPAAPRTVRALLARLAEESPGKLAWARGRLTLQVVLPDDGAFWADGRAHLAAAFVRAAALGARGELLIGPGSDNTTGVLVRVSVTPEGASAKSLRGADRPAAEARLAKVDAALWDERGRAASARAAREPLVADPELRPVHRELCRRLAHVPPERLLEAAAAETATLMPRNDRGRRLSALYPTAAALLHALEHGDERLEAWSGPALFAAALSVLLRAAPEAGAEIAGEVLRASGGRKVRPGVQAVREVALAATATREEDPAATLRALRKAMPTVAPYRTRERVRALPIVGLLARKPSAPMRAAIRAALAKVLGGPVTGEATWKELSTRDACFAGVLGHVLARHGDSADAELLAALRTHPSPLVS